LHEKLRRYDDAEAAYRKALEIDPKSGFAWAQLGQLLHENLQRYDEAEAAYHKALDINPKSGFAWAQLGHLLHKNLQRYDEAEAAYHKTLDIDPKYAWAWAQLGQLLHENLQRYEEAETAYRKAIELSSNWGFPRYRLFKMLLHSLGNVPKAIELAETSKLEINNNSSLAVALHSFAWSSFQSEHWEILPWAEKWAERAYASDGKNMVFRHTLAAITLVRGKLESLLELAKPLYYDEKFLPDYLGDAIQLLIDLAALGKEREAWDLLRGSPAEAKMEPMAVALRTLLGEDLKVAVEIFEIAKDVVKRIETRKSQIAARLEAAKEKESFEYPVTEPIVVH
jgi:tetratricopeptide (TPR) repeat protein